MPASQRTRRERAEEIKRLLAEEGANVQQATREFNEGRYAATATLPNYEALRSEARATKEAAIEQLPDLIETLREAVKANGGHVYLADTAADANAYIEQVARDRDAETLVKSKSMTTEELDLNDHLTEAGIEPFETDLGEFVVQVADEAPSHLVGPAIHRSSESIATLFNDRFEPDRPLETAEELTAFARDYLGEKIQEADIGMTGANFLLAESGSLVIVTNEGNARKCAVTPDTHIAVAGIEKIIPSIADLQPFVELLARSATGQHISRYVTILSPPVETPVADVDGGNRPLSAAEGDREFHLVLVDNGRTTMRDDELLAEVLYCIRCSACLNSCANFQHVGGHAFGGETYTGGIGTGWEAGVEGLDSAASFNDLCTGCSRCVNQCPVKIDIPWINTAVRSRVNEASDPPALDFVYEGLMPDDESSGVSLRSRMFANFERLASVASATAPVSNWLGRSRLNRVLLDRVVGIDRRRPLPRFARRTARDRLADRTVELTDADVVLFADAYTNYVLVDRGMAAVDVLDALGLSVAVPPIHSTGREPLSQGMIETAAEQAASLHEGVWEAVEADKPVLFVEPSDLAMVRRDYERLLHAGAFEALAGGCLGLFEYLDREIGRPTLVERFTGTDTGSSVFYHSHCQQRTLGLQDSTTAILEDLGYQVTTSDVECCGMAGSFGYKSEYYELSREVGRSLGVQVETAASDVVAASGTSCIEQLASLGFEPVVHPVELLEPS